MVERRAQHDLSKAQARLHLVDGFVATMRDLDAVVHVSLCFGRVWVERGHLGHPAAVVEWALCESRRLLRPQHPPHTHTPHTPPNTLLLCAQQAIRQAPDGAAAAAALQAPPFGLSREQSDGVLGMTLRRLTSLEASKLQEEQAQLTAK